MEVTFNIYYLTQTLVLAPTMRFSCINRVKPGKIAPTYLLEEVMNVFLAKEGWILKQFV